MKSLFITFLIAVATCPISNMAFSSEKHENNEQQQRTLTYGALNTKQVNLMRTLLQEKGYSEKEFSFEPDGKVGTTSQGSAYKLTITETTDRPIRKALEDILPKTQLVRTKNDIERLNGQTVKVVGTYRRTYLPVSARPNAKTIPTEKATIVLEDKTEIFIYPLWDERSDRNAEELEKNEGKKVEILGKILAEQGNDPITPQAARIVGPCVIPDKNEIDGDMDSLPKVRNHQDLERFVGKKIRLLGRYETDPQDIKNPPALSNTLRAPSDDSHARPERFFLRAIIVLEDGTPVSLHDPMNKQSLRSPEEQDAHRQKNVEVIGKVGRREQKDVYFFISPEQLK